MHSKQIISLENWLNIQFEFGVFFFHHRYTIQSQIHDTVCRIYFSFTANYIKLSSLTANLNEIMFNERFLHVLQPNRFVHLFIETNKKKWNYYFTTNIMIYLSFFLLKLSECNWLRKLKLSQNKVVVFSLPYYSLHRKSN